MRGEEGRAITQIQAHRNKQLSKENSTRCAEKKIVE
jgi:hypothetical protein